LSFPDFCTSQFENSDTYEQHEQQNVDNVAGGGKHKVRGKKGEGDYFYCNFFPLSKTHSTLRVFFFCPKVLPLSWSALVEVLIE
jgi:hypothetical protein